MTRYTPSAGTLTDYTYNGDWVRTKKTTGSTITEYYQDVAGDLPRVAADKTGTVWNYYVYGSGNSLVGKVGSDNVARYYHHDGTGHVRAITDSTGTVVERYDYDAFGALRNTPTGVANDRRFTGEQYDAETAYTFLRARYYDPALGRFISKDPLGGSKKNPQTLNQYVYTTNNPVHKVDPSGKIEAVLPTPGCAYSSADICDGVGGGGNPIIPVLVGGLIYYYDEVTGALINVIDSGLDSLGILLSGDQSASDSNTSKRGYWNHAKDQMRDRNVTEESVEEAIANGQSEAGNRPGRTVYHLPASNSSTGRGVTVVVEDATGDVVTVIDRGSSFEP